ncbi:MAG: DNA-directed RNA polymerase subunit A' [Nanoarchaeota archaeon]|nr:DNA-directed RNA polymerase subunit A' [Nanoarchaeota archaeon]MBU4452241.1 DNA-directed RNA polymerase subunit A' [Nanoarchaeota archaeon]MCG2723668.1 DNA-directed RNA polymerase subunit A' [archaeon]
MATVKELQFKLISPAMVKKLAVMNVNISDVYDADAYPVEGGVMDPKLGVIDPGMRCRTCGGKLGECTGHFGYIELSRPVINVLYLKQIKMILAYTCHECGGLLVEKEKLKNIKTIDNLKLFKAAGKCQKCGKTVEKIRLDKPSTFFRGKHALTPVEIREQFEKIKDGDLTAMKFLGGRPEWLILTLLLVPPITTRPSITLETGDRSEDDLTHKIVDIIRINKRLADNLEIGAPDFILEDLWELLQYHVSTFFNNELAGVPPARHRSGRALKTLSQRLKTKDGRFRHNLTGKRVNFSARTVVSPDPNISLNEVGVPQTIAKELTIPIKVTKHNLEYMRNLVKNGPQVHPGANYVIRPEGMRKKILRDNSATVAEELVPGCIVERHMIDGDVVLFNRQPSLHRMSVMAHHVRVMSGKTFRINLTVCKPYNADFDGDEMNLHFPQTAEARAEAEELMLVEKNMRSPRFGGPMLGGDQEYISGAYLLTKKETVFSKKDIAQILANASALENETAQDLLAKDKKEYSGKELFSMVLPKGLNVRYKNSVGCEECNGACKFNGEVVIENGILKHGTIDNKGIASFKGNVLDAVDAQFGHAAARLFLDQVTRVISEILMRRGFSISVADINLPAKTVRDINAVIDRQFVAIEGHIEQYRKGKMECFPGRTAEQTLEDLVMEEVWKITSETQKLVRDTAEPTDALIMAKTGARGNIQNLAYMAGLIGQEMIGGKRIFRGYKNRTLSHFQRDNLGPEAHGFVRSSFIKGLSPTEFFFEVMKGREGLMDVALKTKVSGYMQRRLINALQDLKVNSDWTVKDSEGTIIQFVPGEDGIDPSKSDYGTLDRKLKTE